MEDNDLQKLISKVGQLTAEEKAKLMRTLLEKPGITVIFGDGGNYIVAADVAVQISGDSTSDSEFLKTVIDAIAARIKKPRSMAREQR